MAQSGPAVVPNPSALKRQGPIPEPTIESLLQILFQATSPDPSVLASASEHLSDLETHSSLWLRLLDIAFERNNPLSIDLLERERSSMTNFSGQVTSEDVAKRWSAIRTVSIIRFKNGIDKYWRSRVVNRVTITISQDVKAQLRQGLFRCLDEPDRGVALQASVSIARIARNDFPNSWPTLFDNLQRAMIDAHGRITNSSQEAEVDRLTLLRAADVCARTLKELNTVRILAGKIRMTELSQQLLPTLVPMFQQYFTETLPTNDMLQSSAGLSTWSQSPNLSMRIRTSHLLLKSVSHLAVADAGTLSKNAQTYADNRPNYARELFRITPGMLQFIRDVRWTFIQFVQQQQNQEGLSLDHQAILTGLQKHLLFFGKLYAGLAGRERSKAVTWQGWDEVVLWYWQQAIESSPEELTTTSKSDVSENVTLFQQHPTKLLVQALTLLKTSMEDWRKTDTLPATFKDEGMISNMVDILVEKLMLLSTDDLQIWEADAEDWSIAEETETYNTDVRPAAERTLMVLAKAAPSRDGKFVSELLWQKFENLGQDRPDMSLQGILRRDAIYAAVGRELYPHSDEYISEAIAIRLVGEASLSFSDSASWIIIRRRIAWLIWEWSEHVITAHRPMVYDLLVNLLQDVPGKTDAAVRLAAARSLSAMADALEFDSDAFQPYIDASLSRLATLAAGSELHEMDSIKTCTNAMSILIERLGARIAQHLAQLATLVPQLWTLEDPECKARPSIIVFVGKLVRSVELIPHGSQGAGTSLHGIVEVIVRQSLMQENISMLGKDALELWIRTLRSSSQMTDSLFRLLDILPSLLDQPDYCPEACRVAQESTLMAAEAVIAKYGAGLFESFAKVVGDPQSPLILHPISSLDIIVQALHAQGVDTMAWATLLDQSGLFYTLLGSLLKVEDATVVKGYFVALLARLAFIMDNTSIFMELVRSAAGRLEGTTSNMGNTVIKPMAEAWCARVENMASSRKRKITCLGLASLLSNADPQKEPELFNVLPAMIGVWMDIMGDMRQDVGSSEDIGAPVLPNAPPSSPTLSRSFSQAPDLLRRSPSPALSIPGLEGIDDGDDWLQETSPGRARLTELNRLDPVNTVKLTTCISDAMRRAQAHGGAVFQNGLASMDSLVMDIFQKDLNQ